MGLQSANLVKLVLQKLTFKILRAAIHLQTVSTPYLVYKYVKK